MGGWRGKWDELSGRVYLNNSRFFNFFYNSYIIAKIVPKNNYYDSVLNSKPYKQKIIHFQIFSKLGYYLDGVYKEINIAHSLTTKEYAPTKIENIFLYEDNEINRRQYLNISQHSIFDDNSINKFEFKQDYISEKINRNILGYDNGLIGLILNDPNKKISKSFNLLHEHLTNHTKIIRFGCEYCHIEIMSFYNSPQGQLVSDVTNYILYKN